MPLQRVSGSVCEWGVVDRPWNEVVSGPKLGTDVVPESFLLRALHGLVNAVKIPDHLTAGRSAVMAGCT